MVYINALFLILHAHWLVWCNRKNTTGNDLEAVLEDNVCAKLKKRKENLTPFSILQIFFLIHTFLSQNFEQIMFLFPDSYSNIIDTTGRQVKIQVFYFPINNQHFRMFSKHACLRVGALSPWKMWNQPYPFSCRWCV